MLMPEDDKYIVAADRLEDLDILPHIADEIGVTENQLYNWASRSDKNGFPAPMVDLGRYHLYDRLQVMAWHKLYKKANRRQGNRKGLRNQHG